MIRRISVRAAEAAVHRSGTILVAGASPAQGVADRGVSRRHRYASRVITLYAGRARGSRKQVTIPLEVALSGLPNAVRLAHSSAVLHHHHLDDRANAYFARQQVVEPCVKSTCPTARSPRSHRFPRRSARSTAIG
jgi:hypothetical protein